MMGELRYLDQYADDCKYEPEYMAFQEPAGDRTTNSQFVISERMASCSWNSIMRSPIGFMKFNTKNLNRMFEMFPNLPQYKMDSTSVGYFLPLFVEKLGKGVPLEAFLRIKDIDMKFGEYDTDVIISYTACLKFKKDTMHTKKTKTGHDIEQWDELFYDEFRIVSTGSMKTKDDVLYMQILSHKLDNQNKYAQQAYPVKDNMKISENEYREFLSTFGFYLNK